MAFNPKCFWRKRKCILLSIWNLAEKNTVLIVWSEERGCQAPGSQSSALQSPGSAKSCVCGVFFSAGLCDAHRFLMSGSLLPRVQWGAWATVCSNSGWVDSLKEEWQRSYPSYIGPMSSKRRESVGLYGERCLVHKPGVLGSIFGTHSL